MEEPTVDSSVDNMESYFLLPEGGDLSEMGTSVGPNMLERYPIILQPEPPPGDPAQLILNSPPPPAVEPTRPSPGLITPPMTLGTYVPPEQVYQPATPRKQSFAAAPAVTKFTPAQPKSLQGQSPSTQSQQTYAQIGDPLPGQPGVRVGDPLPPDNEGNQWVWDLTLPGLGYFAPATKTPPGGGVEQLTPEDVSKVTEGQTPTTSTPTVTPGTGSPAPGTENPEAPSEYVPARVILDPIKYPDVPELTFTPFNPSANQGSAIRKDRNLRPLNPLRTVPLPQRETDNFIPEPYNTPNYIQYDPEQILAAAMRAIGNQRIRQSIVDQAMENRMLERMRG